VQCNGTLVNGLLLGAFAQGNINTSLRSNGTVEGWCIERLSERKTGNNLVERTETKLKS